MTKTEIELAGAGEAYARAAFAEIVRERGDEAKPSAGFLNADVTRGPARAVWKIVERPIASHVLAHVGKGDELVGAVFVDFTEGHRFDQGDVEAARVRPCDEIWDFVSVIVLERHCVDLYFQPSLDGGVDAFKDLG